MKTAQIIRRFCFREWGGTESVVFHCARELHRLGVSSEILATAALDKPGYERVDGVDIRRYNYFYPYFPMTAERKSALDKKGGNPFVPQLNHALATAGFSLLHCHNLGRLAEMCVAHGKKNKIPVILSLHGGCMDVPEAEKRELLRPLAHTFSYGGIFDRLLKRRCDVLSAADGIICVGENEFEQLKSRFPGKKVIYLPNGVDTERYHEADFFDWKKELNLDPRSRLIVNVSRIDYQKNQKALVRLAERLKARGELFHLLLIGPVSSDWYFQELKKLIHDSDLGSWITIIPGLAPGDRKLTGAYRSADLFILPSLHEPFGIVVLEAWCAGVPVIASDVGGLGRLVAGNPNAVTFDPADDEALIKAYDVSCGQPFHTGAQKLVMQQYSWKCIAGRLKQFYDEVISHGRS